MPHTDLIEPATSADEADVLLQRLLATEPEHVRRTTAFLGRLLGGARERPTPRSFAERHLGPDVETVEMDLSPLVSPSAAAVLGVLMERYPHDVGPGDLEEDPGWRRVRVEVADLAVPDNTGVHFAAGTLAPRPVVVRIHEGRLYCERRTLTVHAAKGDRAVAARVVEEVCARAYGADSIVRGRMLRPRMTEDGLVFEVLPPASPRREDLVLDPAVWAEVDLNLAALTTRREAMRALGLPTRRGILLAGPPGTGKSALTRLIAAELTGRFTTVVVDAGTAEDALDDVYAESRRFGPMLVVLEDLDLYAGDRRGQTSSATLADLLSVLDGTVELDDVLTVATTNDPAALDQAAVRSARFDSIIELPRPSRAAAAAILRRYVAAAPDPGAVDAEAVVAALPEAVSGADLREVVRRAVLRHGTGLTTRALLDAVHEGRWRPETPTGNYL